MVVTTRGGNQTMDPPFLSCIKDYKRVDDEVGELSVELVDKSGKEADTPQKVTPIPRPPPHFRKDWRKRPKMVNTGILLLC